MLDDTVSLGYALRIVPVPRVTVFAEPVSDIWTDRNRRLPVCAHEAFVAWQDVARSMFVVMCRDCGVRVAIADRDRIMHGEMIRQLALILTFGARTNDLLDHLKWLIWRYGNTERSQQKALEGSEHGRRI